ncbi:MAG: hypothetical protein QM788_05480 [Roseateles sp.]|uniref:hypothetical protein n=1 Tax=Roseateles sp. TaxID=1971397 RepID=UPI0039EC01FC
MATLFSGGVALAPVAPAAIAACLANIAQCGIAAAEIAAGPAAGPGFGYAYLAHRAGVGKVLTAAEANAEWMAVKAGNTAAWSDGSVILQGEISVGTRMRMYVTKEQAEFLHKGEMNHLGGWATFDTPPSSAFQLRQDSALSQAFKPTDKGLFVVELEVTKIMPANIGFVGAQAGRQGEPAKYIGGGTQNPAHRLRKPRLVPSRHRESKMRRGLLMPYEMIDIVEVWDNGETLPWLPPGQQGNLERLEEFTDRTGATRVVELRWMHQGKIVSCPFPATVIPDRSGVVLMDEWHFQGQPMEGPEPYPRHLRVLNPDGSLRLRIYPPLIDDHSRIEDSWIEGPRNFETHGIPFGCPARDGFRDIVAEYDWETGAMKQWSRAPWLRY